MKLNGVDFGPIWGASGVEGMWGEGYRHHRLYRLLFPGNFTFKGVTFVSKTFTADRNAGNMSLKEDGCTPHEWLPRCVVSSFRRGGYALNSVGLSNFGMRFYFDLGHWQKRTEPFLLSFMCLGKTRAERAREMVRLVSCACDYVRDFKAPVALQINFSCPNVGHDLKELMQEVHEILAIAADLAIPLIPKFNVLVPPEKAVEIAEDKNCAAICVSNTIPWGQLPDRIDWQRLFHSNVSPLAKYGFGSGGLSGAPITEIVRDWVEKYCRLNPTKQLNVGGGLMCARDVRNVHVIAQHQNGVGSAFVGTAAIVRPWKMRAIITEAYQQFAAA